MEIRFFRHSRHPLLLVVLILGVIDLCLLALLFSLQQPRPLTVAFLDVGQGDAIFIQAPNGNQLLYDAGPPSGALLRALPSVMSFWDRSIDVVVLSHPDLDHIGGVPDVLSRYRVDVALLTEASSTNGVHEETLRVLKERSVDRLIARRGMIIALGGGVFADVLYPDRDMSRAESNSASVVLRVRYGSTSFLLSGDLPTQGESLLLALEHGNMMPVSVLKLGHHGSRTSTSEAWLTALSPEIAVISAGKDNRYGHPHKEVLDLLTWHQVPILSTAEAGTIVFESDGKKVVRK